MSSILHPPGRLKRICDAWRSCFVVTLLVAGFILQLYPKAVFGQQPLAGSIDINLDRLLNASAVNEEYIQRLIRELNRRDEIYKRPPEPVAGMMASIYKNSIDYYDKVKEIDAFYKAAAAKLFQDDLKPFREMTLEHKMIRDNAARDKVLLPEAIAAKVRDKKADKGEKLYLGLPESALTSDPALIEKIKLYTEQQTALFLRWEEEAERYAKEGARYAEEANKKREGLLNGLDSMYQNHEDYRKKLEDTFHSREYEHCLGAPASGLRLDSYAGSGTFAEADRTGRSLKELPGMALSPRTPQEVAAVFKPFGPPKAPPELPWLQLYRSGPVVLKREADLQEARLSCARYELLENAIEIPRVTCEVAKDLTWGMVEGVGKPFENLVDPYQTWGQALKNTGKELTYDNVVGVLEAGEGLLKEGVDAIESGYDGLKEITTDPAAAAEGMKDMLRSSGRLIQDINGTVVGCNPLADPKRPADDASAEEWRRYGESLKGRADHVQDAAGSVKKAGEWYKDHVLDNAVRVLTIYMAAKGGVQGLKMLKTRAVSLLEGTVKRLDNLEAKLDGALERWKSAREVRENIPKESPGGEEALKLAEKHTDIERNIQEQIQIERMDERIKEIEDKAASKAFEEQGKAAARQREFEATERVRLEDGSEIPLGQKVGSGAFKRVVEHPDPKKVYQVLEGREAEGVLKRDQMTIEHLEEAGVGYNKISEVKRGANGEVIMEAERVNSNLIGENIIKAEGKLNAEQQAAILEMTDRLNKHNMVWTDPNPGNFYFERGASGKLVAKILDRDCVVKLSDPIAEGRTSLDFGGGKIIDLNDPSQVRELQRIIMVGDDFAVRPRDMAALAYGDSVSKGLKSDRYTGGKTVPRSMCELRKFVDEDFAKMGDESIDTALEKGRKQFMEKELTGNEEYTGLVKEKGEAAGGLEQDAEALKNAAAKAKPRADDAGPAARPHDPTGNDLPDVDEGGADLLLDDEFFGSVQENLPKMPDIPPELLEGGGGLPQGDFLF